LSEAADGSQTYGPCDADQHAACCDPVSNDPKHKKKHLLNVMKLVEDLSSKINPACVLPE
jgi:hypothetical protein